MPDYSYKWDYIWWVLGQINFDSLPKWRNIPLMVYYTLIRSLLKSAKYRPEENRLIVPTEFFRYSEEELADECKAITERDNAYGGAYQSEASEKFDAVFRKHAVHARYNLQLTGLVESYLSIEYGVVFRLNEDWFGRTDWDELTEIYQTISYKGDEKITSTHFRTDTWENIINRRNFNEIRKEGSDEDV